MFVSIHSNPNKPTALASDEVEAKLRLMLGRYENRIKKVDVDLFHGIQNSECVISIVLGSDKNFEIRDSGQDSFAAVDNCLHRAKRTIARHFKLSQA